jgi:hypothetical protein
MAVSDYGPRCRFLLIYLGTICYYRSQIFFIYTFDTRFFFVCIFIFEIKNTRHLIITLCKTRISPTCALFSQIIH